MAAVLNAYEALIAAGELRPDPEQAAAAARLDSLAVELEHPRTTGFFPEKNATYTDYPLITGATGDFS